MRAGSEGEGCIYLASLSVVEKRRKRREAQITLVVFETLAAKLSRLAAASDPNPD
jgi:hypothetical protein